MTEQNVNPLEANMPLKGYREQIKAAQNIDDARILLNEVRRNCPERYIKRCQRVFDQLPFVKDAT